MHNAQPTFDEKERLAELLSLELLDTGKEERFDAITRFVQGYFSVPIALISLVDSKRQWFKSKQGLDVCETDRSISFCGHAIQQEEVFVVEDTLKDDRFADNPLVSDEPKIRFYAGYPLRTENGYRIGTLCIIDTKPRLFTHQDKVELRDAGQIVEAHIRQRSAELALDKPRVARSLWRRATGYPAGIGRRNAALGCAALTFFIIMALGWQLSFVPREGWQDSWPGDLWHYQLFTSMAALISGLIYYLLRVPENMRLTLGHNMAARVRSERRFRDAIEALPEGFMIYDATQKLAIYNENIVKLYPAIKKIIQGGEVHQFLREQSEQINFVSEAQARSRETGRTPVQARDIKLKDGRWLRVIDRPMRDGGTVCLHTDISDLKDNERALREAKEAAEQANRAKTQFLANVSHEVRTPLNAVLGLLEVLQEDRKLDDRQRHYITTAEHSASHLLELLNDILDISVLEAEQVSLKKTHFNLEHLVRESCRLMDGKAELKELQLEIKLVPGIHRNLLGDKDRIQQILLYVLANAIKFTDAGKIVIQVSTETASDHQVTLKLTVSDSGIGIPEDLIETVFEPFTQIESGTEKRHDGTGLGLSICNKLVTLMQGQIHIESQTNLGTTVQICLPLAIVFDANDLRTTDRSTFTNEPQLNEQHKRCVLLVDDVKTNQLVITSMLEETIYDVDTVNDGEAALAAVMSKQYDVILMDIYMPNLDGLAATRQIRLSNSANNRTPIVAFTANALEGDREKFMHAGMNDYLAKPARKSDLLGLIHRWAQHSIEQP